MKEFGYEVSKDYEKLWLILQSAIEHIHIHCNIDGYAGFRDLMTLYSNPENDVGERVGYIWGDEAFIAKTDKDEFILWCKKYDLTFINPELPNPNAIFYSDGSKINNMDNVLITDIDLQAYYGLKIVNLTIIITRFRHYIYIELYHKHIENEYSTICLDDNMFKWDNNRIINVKKVKNK